MRVPRVTGMDYSAERAYAVAAEWPLPVREVAYKLIRCDQHLRVLWEESVVYLQREPYVVSTNPDLDTSSYVIRVNVTEQPPPIIPLVFGDCLQQLRSALDYLAWQLVVANGGIPSGTPNAGRPPTQFPILYRENKFGIDVAGGVSPEAIAIIEGLQPYHRPAKDGRPVVQDPLYILNDLARRDRHRMVHVVAFGGRAGDSLHFPAEGIEIPFPPPGLALDDGAEIVVPVESRLLECQVDVKGISTAYVALEEPGHEGMMRDVGGIVSRIHDYLAKEVISQFLRFF